MTDPDSWIRLPIPQLVANNIFIQHWMPSPPTIISIINKLNETTGIFMCEYSEASDNTPYQKQITSL